MKRTVLLGLSIFLLCVSGTRNRSAAIGPSSNEADDLAKKKFALLSKDLPQILRQSKFDNRDEIRDIPESEAPLVMVSELRVARRLSASRAKVTIVGRWDLRGAKREKEPDYYITLYLCFMDGCWTVARSETTLDVPHIKEDLQLLILRIDEHAAMPSPGNAKGIKGEGKRPGKR